MAEQLTKDNCTKDQYIAKIKYEMCKMLGLKDGQPCERPGCLEADPCDGCGRRRGILGDKP